MLKIKIFLVRNGRVNIDVSRAFINIGLNRNFAKLNSDEEFLVTFILKI